MSIEMPDVDLILKREITKPKFYVVWREGTTPTYKHESYGSALNECIRLTKLHGGEFHVMACLASVLPSHLVLTEVAKDEMPF